MDFDSGFLLMSTDFRKTMVSRQLASNGETEQIRKALVKFKYTNLNDQDKLLLGHDISYIFAEHFYDFENGCLYPDKSLFFKSNETLLFFSDYLLYSSFISSYNKSPPEADSVLKDISSPNSRKLLFASLREPLSPYLFITFIHNLIDTVNLSSTDHDSSSIENEMCRQIMINAKEFSQFEKFIELHKNLLEKIKSQFRKRKAVITKEMENTYTFYFAHSFYQSIVYPSDQFKDPTFKDMTKDIFKNLRTNQNEMNKYIDRFSCDKDFLSYHTYLYQRALSIEQKDSWVHPVDAEKTFVYPAQLRLTIMSKKVGELMGGELKPIGNSVVIVIVPIDQQDADNLIVCFSYNKKTYNKKVVDGVVDCVFPCFKSVPLEISFVYQNKKNAKDTIVIPSLEEPPENEIMKEVKFWKKTVTIVVTNKFYSHDKPLDNLVVHLNINPTHLFDFVADCFIHQYFSMNARFTYVYRGEDGFEDEDNGSTEITDEDPNKNMFETKTVLRVSQDISGRAFPVDYWLFLIDIAIKYSIPSSYFFARLTEKLNNLWCTSQAYLSMYCIVLYNFFYAIKNSEHTKEEEELFNNTMKTIREKCVKLLMSQLAKPEIYQRPSVTSLILLLSLSNDGKESDLINILKTVFLSSMNNINSSIYNLLIYNESETECTSMDLLQKIPPEKKDNIFPEGPHHLPLCNVDVESLKKALDLVLYRSRSISSFYLESFLPNFANIGDNIMNDLFNIAISFAKAFCSLEPMPDQKELVYFVTIYKQLYQLFRKKEELNPAVIFNESIENWMFDLSSSMIEYTERSIKLDTFEKKSDKARMSDSFFEIFTFFRQGFDFITSLNFTQKEARYKLFFFLSINSAICSTYIDILMSLISKKYRSHFIVQQSPQIIQKAKPQVKPKSPFPSWCPDITDSRSLTFESMCIIINNVASIRLKWFKYIVIYDKYLPNQPQITAALKATSDRRSLKKDESSNLLLNENESSEETAVEENKDTFKDPCFKLTTKVSFMINFLRLELTYEIIDLLENKMWEDSVLKKVNIKQLREGFFADNSNRVDEDNIFTVFDHIFDAFKEKVEKMKQFLLITLQLKCLPQLVRGLEDGIFECMIPLAFSSRTKAVFPTLMDKVDGLFRSVLAFIEEDKFGQEISRRCESSLRFMGFVKQFIHRSQKEIEAELKTLKNKGDQNSVNVILLSIVLQAVSAVPLPKAVNPSFTLISLE